MRGINTHKSINACDLMAEWRQRELELVNLNPGTSIFEIWREMAKDMVKELEKEEVKELIVPAWLYESGGMPEYTYLLSYSRECGLNVNKQKEAS